MRVVDSKSFVFRLDVQTVLNNKPKTAEFTTDKQQEYQQKNINLITNVKRVVHSKMADP